IKHHVETLRRLKYRPTGGFAQFFLADALPAVTWSVLDHERRPKLGYAALRDACRPVIVVADRLPARVAPGQALALDVHVVSDLRLPIEAGRGTARLAWSGPGESAYSPDGESAGGPGAATGGPGDVTGAASGGGAETWSWVGDVPADACVRVGTLQFVVP